MGKEVGEQGTPHLQGYIALKDAKKKFRPLPTFAVKRDDKNAMHFERAKGNRRQNYFYCSKEGDFVTNIPKPTMTLEEAQQVLEQPAEIVETETECYVKNGELREAAAKRIVMQDFDIMKDKFQQMLMR